MAFLGVATGIIALWRAAWPPADRAEQILNVSFVFDGGAALMTVVGGGAATLLFGLMGALAALAGPAGGPACATADGNVKLII